MHAFIRSRKDQTAMLLLSNKNGLRVVSLQVSEQIIQQITQRAQAVYMARTNNYFHNRLNNCLV